jgi:hypothetical protein
MRFSWCQTLCALSAIGIANQLSAGMITFSFSGTINSVFFDGGTPTEFADLDTITGTYTFDSADSDSHASPNNGLYINSISSIELSMGTYSASFGPGDILVRDNIGSAANPYDLYYVSAYASDGLGYSGTPVILGTLLYSFELSLIDTSATAFSNDALLLTPPDPADYSPISNFVLRFQDASFGSYGSVTATVDSISLETASVPEPASFALLGLFSCLTCAGAAARRRSRPYSSPHSKSA